MNKKNVMRELRSFLVLSLALVTAFNSAAIQAHAEKTGNGGDSIALEFTSIGRGIVATLKANPTSFPEVNVSEFENAVEKTEIVTTDKTILDSVEKDAVNYPDLRMIKVNRSRWHEVDEKNRRNALVFHEYLGILRIDDSNYKISGRLLTLSVGGASGMLLLTQGNYRPVGNETGCDFHVEVNSLAGKVFLTPIPNQRLLNNCLERPETTMYLCGVDGVCQDEIPFYKIQIIDNGSFIAPDKRKFIYVDNNPVLSANRFSNRWSRYGYIGGFTGQSYRNETRCWLDGPAGFIWCDDRARAKSKFCPVAQTNTENESIELCQNETGKTCRIIARGSQQVYSNNSVLRYNDEGKNYLFEAELYCEVTGVVAAPVETRSR